MNPQFLCSKLRSSGSWGCLPVTSVNSLLLCCIWGSHSGWLWRVLSSEIWCPVVWYKFTMFRRNFSQSTWCQVPILVIVCKWGAWWRTTEPPHEFDSNFPRQFHPFGNFIWFQGHEVCHLNSQGFNCEFIPEGLIIHVCVCTSVSCRCQRAAYWTLLSWFIFAFILCLWNSPNFC